jgi:hypothetical protein
MRVSAEKNGLPVKVTDLATFLAKACGYEVKEDLPKVLDSWASFEAMIALMKPRNMAAMMEELFPELVEAMPGWMGRMMCLAGRLGLLPLMKPLFPILFPHLMPRAMGNLMPHLLPEVVPLIAQPLVDYLVERCRLNRRQPAAAAQGTATPAPEAREA